MPFENRDESLLTIVSKYVATCNGIYAVGRQILRVASVQRSVKRSPKQRVCRSYGRASVSATLRYRACTTRRSASSRANRVRLASLAEGKLRGVERSRRAPLANAPVFLQSARSNFSFQAAPPALALTGELAYSHLAVFIAAG